jgi:hypothetical protein
MPTRKLNPTKATTAIGRSQSPSQRASAKPQAKAARKQLVGKAPLGSLPARKVRSAASSKNEYGVGDVVFWGTPTTAGEYTFIGYPKGEGWQGSGVGVRARSALRLMPMNAPRLAAATRSAAESIASDISATILVARRPRTLVTLMAQ